MTIKNLLQEKKIHLRKILDVKNEQPSEQFLRLMMIYEAWYCWIVLLQEELRLEREGLSDD